MNYIRGLYSPKMQISQILQGCYSELFMKYVLLSRLQHCQK